MNPLDYDPTYPENHVTLAQYIRKFRKDKGLFQVDLAKMIGVDEMSIVNWEKGRTKPEKKYMEKVKVVIPEVGTFPRVEVG